MLKTANINVIISLRIVVICLSEQDLSYGVWGLGFVADGRSELIG